MKPQQKQQKPNSLTEIFLRWFAEHYQQHPWRLLWEKTKNPYYVWLSEIMLQQTTIKAVIPKYEFFLTLFPDVQSLAKATPLQLKQAVQGLGYYRRFDFMLKAAQKLVFVSPKNKINWPKSYDEWMSLPGIGPYTAAAIASITLKEAVAAIDGNVERVFSRLFKIARPFSDREFKNSIKEKTSLFIDAKEPGDYNQAIMEFGQFICLPQSPKCTNCPVQNFCAAFQTDTVALFPPLAEKKSKQDVYLDLIIPRKRKKIGLIHRDDQSFFLKGTLGFPFVLGKKRKKPDFVHHITKYKIHVQVRFDLTEEIERKEKITWVKSEDVLPKLVSSLDKKAFLLSEAKNL